jgi:peptidylprolyl isomerase/peptidyl-prolyl cis-trans isomerase A (cyclophilin A)
VKESIEAASRAQAHEVVRRRLLKWTFLPELYLSKAVPVESRPLRLDDDTHLQRYPNRSAFLFNHSSQWAYLCTPDEHRWLDRLLTSSTDEADKADEARRREFYRRLAIGRFVRPAIDPPSEPLPVNRHYRAEIVTDRGTLRFALSGIEAPRTTGSFVHLARAGHYDGLVVERSYPGAYVEAGGWLSQGEPLYVLSGERTTRATRRGSLWMAIAIDGARFAICRDAWPSLDARGAVFGELTDGDATLDALAAGDRIWKITVEESPAD